MTRLPKDWTDAVNKRYGGLSFKFGVKLNGAHGDFNPGSGAIRIAVLPSDQGRRTLGSTPMERTLLHEMTHGAQYSNPNIRVLEQAFMASRGTGQIKQLPNYSSNCLGDADKFSRVYTGRNYGGGPSGFREVITTGMEGMITPPVPGEPMPSEASFGKSGDNPDKDFQQFMTGTMLLA